MDATLIPTGAFRAVAGTPFDFRRERVIGAGLAAQPEDEQLQVGRGYDHNFVLNSSSTAPGSEHVCLAARLYEPASGRMLEIDTSEPGLQFYPGNLLDGSIVGKQGLVYRHRSGLCLEPQHFPNSPKQLAFPSTILHPRQEYRTLTVYRLMVQ